VTEDLRALAAVVQRLSGFVVRDGQLASLDAALARVDPRLTPTDLLRDPDLTGLERLVDEVAIKETFFLRHVEEMDDIDWTGKAARATAARRPLRVWSVGCSTGEEAYSLALLAAEALGNVRAPIDVLGTDLSLSALALAERGLYGTRSMRLVNRARRLRWFVADGEQLRVNPELRGLVRFARHNIVHDQFPPEGEALFDLVVCRNVLIYFDGATGARVTAALGEALAPGARLLLGTVDRLGSPPVKDVAPEERAVPRMRVQTRSPNTRRLNRDAGTIESPAEAAHAAFDVGSRALSAGDAVAAIHALRRALYLDPRRAVVALQLARAHEALGHAEPARRAYWRALRLVDEVPDPGPRLYDRVAAGDVAAACRARLAALPNPEAGRGDA
jgi:chemotaxis methyl-accepting protein methylase